MTIPPQGKPMNAEERAEQLRDYLEVAQPGEGFSG